MQNETLITLADKLHAADPTKMKSIVGFDGFIDQVIHVVDRRTGPDAYERVQTLTDYGQKFIDAAGLSMNIEMVPVNRKVGGVATIFANSLSKMGFDLTYIGALGKDGVNPVFSEFARRATVISISDPGESDAIEFMDGKVISSKLEPLKDVNWENLLTKYSAHDLVLMFDAVDFVGFADWTLVINVETIWDGLLSEVLPHMENRRCRPMLFDLADPAKRTDEDVLRALSKIEQFEQYFEVTLGLNYKEALGVASRFGANVEDFDGPLDVARYVKNHVAVSRVVVHPVKQACAVTDTEAVIVDGPYCARPTLTTGAGDNFNAGFVMGIMLGFSLEESLYLGTANSGYYVRNADSASFGQLASFAERWGRGEVSE